MFGRRHPYSASIQYSVFRFVDFSLTAAPKLGMLPPVNQGIVRIASRLRYGSLARALMLAALTMTVTSCAGSGSAPSAQGDSAEMIRIQLDGADPAASSGEGLNGVGPKRFQVGFGRNGIACAGTRFEEGWTPLGTFRVNAILGNVQGECDSQR